MLYDFTSHTGCDTIKFIGVDDNDIQLFENQYAVPQGISYNSYVVLDEQVAIFDTVDRRRADEWTMLLDGALQGRKPQYLIVHHMEPDHSACICDVMKRYPQLILVGSAKAISMIPQFFEDFAVEPSRLMTVKDGDVLSLGHHKLRFLMAPMVHWPEVMMTLDTTTGTLFSADAFGRFGSLSYGEIDWLSEGRRYYCNIVGKYGPQVMSVLRKLPAGEVRCIAPLHGPVLSGDLSPFIEAYTKWASYTPESDGVLVAYASVYGNTARCALEVTSMLHSAGVEALAFDLCRGDISEAVAQAFRYGRWVLASITYDASIFPAMYNFLHHLQMKGVKNRRVALIENGSWAPIASKIMADELAKMKGITIVEPRVTLRSAMRQSDAEVVAEMVSALMQNQ